MKFHWGGGQNTTQPLKRLLSTSLAFMTINAKFSKGATVGRRTKSWELILRLNAGSLMTKMPVGYGCSPPGVSQPTTPN